MKIRIRRENLVLSFALFLILIISLSIIPDYLIEFDSGYNSLSEVYGSSIIDWIDENTCKTDVFLAGDARRLSWLTNRAFVGFSGAENAVDDVHLENLIETYNITYVVIDSFLINHTRHTQFIFNLFSEHITIGQITLIDYNVSNIFFNTASYNDPSSPQIELYGLKLVFSSSDVSGLRIFEVVRLSCKLHLVFSENFFGNEWIPRLDCVYLPIDGRAKLSISNDATWSYIYLYEPLDILSDSFSKITVKVKGDGHSSTSFWIGLIDSAGLWHKCPSDTLLSSEYKLYTYDLPKSPTFLINNIYLGISGNEKNIVEYESIFFYYLEMNEISGS